MQGTKVGADCSLVQVAMTFPTDSECLLLPKQCPRVSFADGEPEALKPHVGPRSLPIHRTAGPTTRHNGPCSWQLGRLTSTPR